MRRFIGPVIPMMFKETAAMEGFHRLRPMSFYELVVYAVRKRAVQAVGSA